MQKCIASLFLTSVWQRGNNFGSYINKPIQILQICFSSICEVHISYDIWNILTCCISELGHYQCLMCCFPLCKSYNSIIACKTSVCGSEGKIFCGSWYEALWTKHLFFFFIALSLYGEWGLTQTSPPTTFS